MKGADTLFHSAVGDGRPRMLAEVLGSGGDEKGFDIPGRVGRVSKKSPPHGAVPAADRCQLLHRASKFASPLRVDPVFDHDEHRSLLRPGFADQNRLGPMHRRSQVDLLSAR